MPQLQGTKIAFIAPHVTEDSEELSDLQCNEIYDYCCCNNRDGVTTFMTRNYPEVVESKLLQNTGHIFQAGQREIN